MSKTSQQARDHALRAAILSSDSVQPDVPAEDVDIAKGAASGLAFVENAIETEPPTANVKKALADEAFMAQRVEVAFADPANENEPQFVECTVNGIYFSARRGETRAVPRSHLAVIARSKQHRVSQQKVTLADGSMAYKEKVVPQPMYPFSVLSDPAGARGVTWLRQVMQAT